MFVFGSRQCGPPQKPYPILKSEDPPRRVPLIALAGSIPLRRTTKPRRCYTAPHEVEEIAEVVAKLPPDQLARFRRWFTAFEAGRSDHAEELDSTATKLGRLAGRTFAELKKRAKEPLK
jgi:hypothetical protein